MSVKSKENPRIVTKTESGIPNGFLVPIYNIHEGFFPQGQEPQQVYLTAVAPGMIKGPHLHFIRTGCFTCIKGNVRVVLKIGSIYEILFSGEANGYRSIMVPAGTPAALQNIGSEDAYVLNMPQPAWTPDMKDEHTADFSDFDFSQT